MSALLTERAVDAAITAAGGMYGYDHQRTRAALEALRRYHSTEGRQALTETVVASLRVRARPFSDEGLQRLAEPVVSALLDETPAPSELS